MSRQQHTPGPWEVREIVFEATPFQGRRVYRVEIVAPQVHPVTGSRVCSRDICQIVDYHDWTDHPANARLIAAAPELLQRLTESAAMLNAAIRIVRTADSDYFLTLSLWEEQVKASMALIAKVEGPAPPEIKSQTEPPGRTAKEPK